MDEAKSKDEDVATAIIKANEALDTAFGQARSFMAKCYDFAEYISHEEENVVKAIEEGNVNEFKDFLADVLDKSGQYQKDIMTLLDVIAKEKQRIIEESLKAKEKKEGGTAKDGGIFGAIRSTAGTIASAIWGSSLHQYYEKAITAFEESREALVKIEIALMKVNEQLKLGVDNNLSGMKEKTNKLDRPVIKRSIIKIMETVKAQSEHLKEYCRPLKDAKDLEDLKKVF